MAQTTYSFRIDENLKKQAEAFCDEVGMNLSTAIMVCLKRIIRENRFPFEISAEPDYSLETALRESLSRTNLHGPYNTASEAIAAMLEDSSC